MEGALQGEEGAAGGSRIAQKSTCFQCVPTVTALAVHSTWV